MNRARARPRARVRLHKKWHQGAVFRFISVLMIEVRAVARPSFCRSEFLVRYSAVEVSAFQFPISNKEFPTAEVALNRGCFVIVIDSMLNESSKSTSKSTSTIFQNIFGG